MSAAAVAFSLIAVFITRDGLLVASDTAALKLDVRSGAIVQDQIVRKIVPCGNGSVVGLTGRTAWDMKARDGRPFVVDSYAVVAAACRQFAAETTVTLKDVANRVANALAREANKSWPSGRVGLENRTTLQGLIVAGFDTNGPAVFLGKVFQPEGADMFTFSVEAPNNRCINALGKHEGLVVLLGQRTLAGLTVPSSSVVTAARKAFRQAGPGCASWTHAEAEAFFKTGVDFTYENAKSLQHTPGVVNWPIDWMTPVPKTNSPIRREERADQVR